MKKNPAWAISGASIGSSAIVAVTILHFIKANLAGITGSDAVFFAGAIGTGLVAAICHHLCATPEHRGPLKFLLVAISVAVVTATVVLAVLIAAFWQLRT